MSPWLIQENPTYNVFQKCSHRDCSEFLPAALKDTFRLRPAEDHRPDTRHVVAELLVCSLMSYILARLSPARVPPAWVRSSIMS